MPPTPRLGPSLGFRAFGCTQGSRPALEFRVSGLRAQIFGLKAFNVCCRRERFSLGLTVEGLGRLCLRFVGPEGQDFRKAGTPNWHPC